MFCSGCGKEIVQGTSFCRWCGQSNALPRPRAVIPVTTVAAIVSPHREKRVFRPVRLIGGVAVLGLLLVWMLSRSESPTSASSGENSSSSPDPVQQVSTKHHIGETVSVGYWSYRCNGTRWQQTIGSDLAAERADASFLVVDLTARNDDRTASTFPPAKLIDLEGREYDESSSAIFMPRSFGVLKELNPGVSSSGYLVFDVPPGNYALKLSGGIESRNNTLIDLGSQ